MLVTLDVSLLTKVEKLALARLLSEKLGQRVPVLGEALAEAVLAAVDNGIGLVTVAVSWPDPDRPVEDNERELQAAARWVWRAVKLAPRYETLAGITDPLLQVLRAVMAQWEQHVARDIAVRGLAG